MKRIIIYSLFISSFFLRNYALFAQDQSWQYLGQTPPGSMPVLFAPEIVSLSGRYEYGLAVSPDGKQIIYKAEYKNETYNGLYTVTKSDTGWSNPYKIKFREDNFWEFEAFFTSAGDKIFFTSKDGINSSNERFFLC